MEIQEERRRRIRRQETYTRPTTPELYKMVGGDKKKEDWRSNYSTMNKRSVMAARVCDGSSRY